MARSLIRLAALLVAAVPAFGQVPPTRTPAEQASRALNQDIARDRARDAAEDARAADTAAAAPAPAASQAAQQLESDRATIRPDVGRPEQSGSGAGTLRSSGEDRNVSR